MGDVRRPIVKLEQHVVNRIAAGEVIQRPSSALKEMLENSLDAGSTTISVTSKNGGIKLLQIQDNGHGISLADMPIVCERFTTSKLKTFEDLREIQTFGFRGEALASISHVAHLSITSMQQEDQCAHKAHYSDGKLVTESGGLDGTVHPCAGVKGTTISVKDLFYNMQARKAALKNTADEFNRIVDVVARYAVDNPGVAMSCRKANNRCEVQTRGGGSSRLDAIRVCFGADVAKELHPIHAKKADIGLKVEGYVTGGNYTSKKGSFVLFINKRSVDSAHLRRNVEHVYSTVLPRGSHPFVYLSITLPPKDVDVNVHPTKREVQFLNEEAVVETIQRAVTEQVLSKANDAREFETAQGVLAPLGAAAKAIKDARGGGVDTKQHDTKKAAEREGIGKRKAASSTPRPSALVRTDTNDSIGRLDGFVVKRQATCHCAKPFRPGAKTRCPVHPVGVARTAAGKDAPSAPTAASSVSGSLLAKPMTRLVYSAPLLTSIQRLLDAIQDDEDRQLTQAVAQHTFVGLVDGRRMCIQHETQLLLVDFLQLSKDLFYQQVIRQFSHLPIIRLDPALDIGELLAMDDSLAKDDVANMVTLLVSKAAMVAEYFSICISDDGKLESIPQIVERYRPHFYNMPAFVRDLCTTVDWKHEQQCFHDVATALADLFTHDPMMYNISEGTERDAILPSPDGNDVAAPLPESDLVTMVKHFLSPAMRAFLTISKKNGRAILPIARLEQLYRVFERC